MANRYYLAGLRCGEPVEVRQTVGSDAPVKTGFVMLAVALAAVGAVKLAGKFRGDPHQRMVHDVTAGLRAQGLTPRKYPGPGGYR